MRENNISITFPPALDAVAVHCENLVLIIPCMILTDMVNGVYNNNGTPSCQPYIMATNTAPVNVDIALNRVTKTVPVH